MKLNTLTNENHIVSTREQVERRVDEAVEAFKCFSPKASDKQIRALRANFELRFGKAPKLFLVK